MPTDIAVTSLWLKPDVDKLAGAPIPLATIATGPNRDRTRASEMIGQARSVEIRPPRPATG